jgi:hypothetical protein
MTFTVDKIFIDPTCGQNGSQAAGTHTVVLDVRVSTSAVVAGDTESLTKRISPLKFWVYGTDKSVHSPQPDTCTDHAPPTVYAADSKYRAQIAFSVDTMPVEISLPINGSRGTEALTWKM